MKESRALKISRVKVNKAKSVIKKPGNTLEKSGSSPDKWLDHSTRSKLANNFTPGIDLNIQPLKSRGAAIKKIALPRASTHLVLHKITLCKYGKDRAIFGNIFISEKLFCLGQENLALYFLSALHPVSLSFFVMTDAVVHKKRIYILDDEVITVRRLVHALSKDGYELEGFVTAAEAIARISKDAPDLLITDVRLGDANAWRCCSRSRAWPRRPWSSS